jgi:hypothetical protein
MQLDLVLPGKRAGASEAVKCGAVLLDEVVVPPWAFERVPRFTPLLWRHRRPSSIHLDVTVAAGGMNQQHGHAAMAHHLAARQPAVQRCEDPEVGERAHLLNVEIVVGFRILVRG